MKLLAQESSKQLQNISNRQTKCDGYPQCNQVHPAFFAVVKTWEHLRLIWVLQKTKVIIYRIYHQYVYIYNYIMGKTWSTNSEKRDVKLKIDEAENYVCETVKHLNALLM